MRTEALVADRDVEVVVQDRRREPVLDIAHVEHDRASARAQRRVGLAVDDQVVDHLQLLERVVDDLALLFTDDIHRHGVKGVERRAEADRAGDVGRAGLFAIGELLDSRVAVEVDVLDHATADFLRLLVGEQLLAGHDDTGAAGGVDLVAREHDDVEVLVRIVVVRHVDLLVGRHRRRVDHDQCAVAVRELRDLVHGIDDPGDVRDAGDRHVVDTLAVLGERLAQPLHVDTTDRRLRVLPPARARRCRRTPCDAAGRSSGAP